MAKQSYQEYASKNGWSLSKRQLIYWARKHQEACAKGDRETVSWIEDLLTDINYHTCCGLFQQGRYEEAIEGMYPKRAPLKRNYGTQFVYKKHIFLPYGKLKTRTPRTMNWNKRIFIQNFDYEDFLKASGNSEADIYMELGGSDFYLITGSGLAWIDKSEVIRKMPDDVPMF